MKLAVISMVVLMAGAVRVSGQALNVDSQIVLRELDSPRKVEYYVSCASGQGSCDTRGLQLRTYIPIVARGESCFRCSPRENRNLRLMVSTMQRRYPRCWQILVLAAQDLPTPSARGCAN
ncbi:uncharacterized protein LOC122248805 [Penaeus japonicus]|uniref:uncharacterized protein LOC122248805 n=1 Tax=Penaeus japonicus TaxID=27405 RepID=UPI001C70E2A9|nr:uncharacterized protein LOC122248805 [Penaeus japonicus]